MVRTMIVNDGNGLLSMDRAASGSRISMVHENGTAAMLCIAIDDPSAPFPQGIEPVDML
jgi:hypothetical protein